ncbi:MAG: hypothetical protein ACRCUS_10685 [Anaerovoracaceae bacterium]
MNYYTVREVRTESKRVWEEVAKNGGGVITNNGKPAILMTPLKNGGAELEEIRKEMQIADDMRMFDKIRERNRKAGWMTLDEINAVIDEVKQEMREEGIV